MKLKEKEMGAQIEEKDSKINQLLFQKDKDLERIEKYAEKLKEDFDYQMS